jgi:hypothetical protein
VLNYGTYVWNGPGPTPTGITTTTDWQFCFVLDPFPCSIVDTGDVFIPYNNNYTVNAIITIAGTDGNGDPVSTSETFPLGQSIRYDAAPTLVLPPSISGTHVLGNTLTGNPGEWSQEFGKDYQWLRCTGSTLGSCSPISGATLLTYVVDAADSGMTLRFKVVAYSGEREFQTEAISNGVSAGGATVNCGSSCYTWSVTPTIDRNGADQPAPVTGLPARLVNDGTYAWNDPTSAPSIVTSAVTWFTCPVASPTSCTQVGTGRTYTPTTAGVLLEARLTLSGSFAADGSVRTGSIAVPFGTVRDANLPPDATTPPTISEAAPSTTYVGDVLTANPGVWEFALNGTRTYNWLRCAAANPTSCTPVGVTTPTYTVQPADQTEFASVMRVDVTAPGYVNAGTVRSAPSAVLTGYSKRLITAPTVDGGVGGPRDGVTATATQAVWSAMPATVSGPTIEWQSCTSTDPATCFGPIFDELGNPGTTTSFAVSRPFVGRYLRVRSAIVGETFGGGAGTEATGF